MKKIQDYLIDLGLTEIEAKLYQGLLETGPTTVKKLSDHVGIKRITAHFNVESLISKGLITQTIAGSRRQILVESSDRLKYFLDKKIDSTNNLLNRFPDFLKTVSSLRSGINHNKEVEIKYYEGRNAVNQIYINALISNEFRAYVNCRELARVFPENVDLFLKTHRKRKNMVVWEIMEYSIESRSYIKKMPKERYSYKIIPKGINLSVIDYMIFDGKVAIVNLENNTTGIVISNEHYYQNAKSIYQFVWQMLNQI